MGTPASKGCWYFDGETAARLAATLRVTEALEICDGDNCVARWPFETIRQVDGGVGALRLRSTAATELARLEIFDATTAAMIRSKCPAMGSVDLRRVDVLRIVLWSLAASASLILIAWFGIPVLGDRVAGFVPPSVEARLGLVAARQMEAVFGKKLCRDPAGLAALNALVAKLAAAGDLKEPLTVTVVDSAVPNALALPGGQVFVLAGLIDRVENPDELAGVLAHELGHVAHRDALRLMIAGGGRGFLLSLLFGDVTGAGALILASQAVVTSANTREAETAADAFSAATLHRLGRSSAALGRFLVRMTGEQDIGYLSLFATHPASKDRLEALSRDDLGADGAPLASTEDWIAIKAVCLGTSSSPQP